MKTAIEIAKAMISEKERLWKPLPDGRIGAYSCPAGVPTIGRGITVYSNGQKVTLRDIITKEKEEAEFNFIVGQFAKDVDSLVKSPVNVYQKAALIDFAYNVGSDIDIDQIPEGLGDSHLLKLVNANPNDPAIETEFMKWDKAWVKDAHGVAHLCVLPGLVTRRADEYKLYKTITV